MIVGLYYDVGIICFVRYKRFQQNPQSIFVDALIYKERLYTVSGGRTKTLQSWIKV